MPIPYVIRHPAPIRYTHTESRTSTGSRDTRKGVGTNYKQISITNFQTFEYCYLELVWLLFLGYWLSYYLFTIKSPPLREAVAGGEGKARGRKVIA